MPVRLQGAVKVPVDIASRACRSGGAGWERLTVNKWPQQNLKDTRTNQTQNPATSHCSRRETQNPKTTPKTRGLLAATSTSFFFMQENEKRCYRQSDWAKHVGQCPPCVLFAFFQSQAARSRVPQSASMKGEKRDAKRIKAAISQTKQNQHKSNKMQIITNNQGRKTPTTINRQYFRFCFFFTIC